MCCTQQKTSTILLVEWMRIYYWYFTYIKLNAYIKLDHNFYCNQAINYQIKTGGMKQSLKFTSPGVWSTKTF